MEELVTKIMEELNLNRTDYARKPYKGFNGFTNEQLINSILVHKVTRNICSNLGIGGQTFARTMRTIFPDVRLNGGGQTWEKYLLRRIGRFRCPKCDGIKNRGNVILHTKGRDHYVCKTCKAKQQKIWYNNHRDEQCQRVIRRRRKLDRELLKEEIISLLDKAQYRCENCEMTNEEHKTKYGYRLTIDHVIPISKGGLTELDNLQILCVRCNSSKCDKYANDKYADVMERQTYWT